MTTYGDDLYAKRIYVGNPPKEITGDNTGDQNIDSVLKVGNTTSRTAVVGRLDAGNDSISSALNGDINANTVECNTLSAFANMVTPQCSATTVNATDGFVSNVISTNVTSTGVINWTAFNPPLVVSGTPSLSQVLGAGGDAGALPISDLSKLDFEEAASVQTEIVGVPTTLTKCTNLDLSDSSNTAPNLAQVMSGTGNNSVGTVDLDLNDRNILDVNSITSAIIDAKGSTGVPIPLVRMFDDGAEIIFDPFKTKTKTGTKITGAETTLTKCTNLDLSTGNTFPAGDLAATLLQGNKAGGKGIDMEGQSITDANTLQGKIITASGTTGSDGQIGAERQISAPVLRVMPPHVGQVQNSGISFAGITTTTNIAGPSVSNPTVCTNLDLRSGTNLFTASTAEQYEWGGYWKNPQTLLTDGTLFDQVYMASYESDFTGWRYFRPMSDGEDQLNPTAGTNQYDYMPYSSVGNPLIGFYVKTAPTLITSHSSQIISLSFPVTRYGYGRIYLGLYYVPDSNPSATPVFIADSFRLLTENIAQPGLADLRKGGHITFDWVLQDIPSYPVDGTQWRIYPVMRTDDTQDKGALEIRIGDGVPNNSSLGTAQNGQLSLYGRPFPSSYTKFEANFTTAAK